MFQKGKHCKANIKYNSPSKSHLMVKSCEEIEFASGFCRREICLVFQGFQIYLYSIFEATNFHI